MIILTSCNITTKEIILVDSFPIIDSKDCGCRIKFLNGDTVEGIDKKCRLKNEYSVGDTILVDIKLNVNER